jgi:hypothetical protein
MKVPKMPKVSFLTVMTNKKILLSLAQYILILLAFSSCSLYAGPSSDNETKESGKNCYRVTFFSLKQAHSIGDSRFLLHDNGTFEFDIEKEELLDSKGTYRIDGVTFEATAEFTIKKRRVYHYTFSFKGIAVFDTYAAGTAKLKEYIEENKLTQEVSFLFFGSRKTENNNKKISPFF